MGEVKEKMRGKRKEGRNYIKIERRLEERIKD